MDVTLVYFLHFQKGGVVCRFVGDNQTGGVLVNGNELHWVVAVGAIGKAELFDAHRYLIFGFLHLGIVGLHGFGYVQVVDFVIYRKENVLIPVAD
jgi:hypothetical protein